MFSYGTGKPWSSVEDTRLLDGIKPDIKSGVKSDMELDAYNIIAFDKFGISYSGLLYNIQNYNKIYEFSKINYYYNSDGTKKKLTLNSDGWCGFFALSFLVSTPFMPLLLVNNIFVKLFVVVATILIFYLFWAYFTNRLMPREYGYLTKQDIKNYFEDKNKLDTLQSQINEVHKIYVDSQNLNTNSL